MSEAVSSMLDRSRLGRLELQQQNQEDVLRCIMPSLAEGLAMRHCPDLRVGCYMILTVLSSKASLSEELLAAIMEMVVYKWKDVTHAGLICLVVLAQRKQAVALPKKVSKALISIGHLTDDLVLLSKDYNVEKLVLTLILGMLTRLGRAGDADRLRLIRLLLEANLMQPKLVATALTHILRLLQGTASSPGADFDSRSALADLFLCLCDSETVGSVVQAALEDTDVEVRQTGLTILQKHGGRNNVPETPDDDVEMHDTDDTSIAVQFEDLVERIPVQTAFETSFLSHSESYVFTSLCDAFLEACRSERTLDAFTELPVLRKSLAMTEPLFVSFFVRVWCGHYPVAARVAALRMLSKYFRTEKLVVDVQVLLPYALYALADSAPLVRRAATEVVLALASSYKNVGSQIESSAALPILGKAQVYGPGKESEEIGWLPLPAVIAFLQEWLLPHLEEFRLHADQMGRSIVNGLTGNAEKKEAEKGHQTSSKSVRASILAWLCSHVVNTPMYAVKARLLLVLTRISKVGRTATATLLTPILAGTITYGQSNIEKHCEKENLDVSQYIDRVMDIAMPDDDQTIKLLQDFISNSHTTADPLLEVAAFRRLSNLWPLFKQQMQTSLGRTMLDLALRGFSSQSDEVKQREASETLRTVKLSTETLQSFMQACPNLSDDGSKRSSKRKRTISPPSDSGDDIKRLSFVLELVESSVTEAHLPLLAKLSHVMADLQGYKQQSGIELYYLELLTLDSMRGILDHSTVRSNLRWLCKRIR